jgi:hypothetical protein
MASSQRLADAHTASRPLQTHDHSSATDPMTTNVLMLLLAVSAVID